MRYLWSELMRREGLADVNPAIVLLEIKKPRLDFDSTVSLRLVLRNWNPQIYRFAP